MQSPVVGSTPSPQAHLVSPPSFSPSPPFFLSFALFLIVMSLSVLFSSRVCTDAVLSPGLEGAAQAIPRENTVLVIIQLRVRYLFLLVG